MTYTKSQIIKAANEIGIDAESLMIALNPKESIETPKLIGKLNSPIGFKNGDRYEICHDVYEFKGKYYVGQYSYYTESLSKYIDFINLKP